MKKLLFLALCLGAFPSLAADPLLLEDDQLDQYWNEIVTALDEGKPVRLDYAREVVSRSRYCGRYQKKYILEQIQQHWQASNDQKSLLVLAAMSERMGAILPDADKYLDVPLITERELLEDWKVLRTQISKREKPQSHLASATLRRIPFASLQQKSKFKGDVILAYTEEGVTPEAKALLESVAYRLNIKTLPGYEGSLMSDFSYLQYWRAMRADSTSFASTHVRYARITVDNFRYGDAEMQKKLKAEILEVYSDKETFTAFREICKSMLDRMEF